MSFNCRKLFWLPCIKVVILQRPWSKQIVELSNKNTKLTLRAHDESF